MPHPLNIPGDSNTRATYGAFSAVVVLLIWLWLTNTVMLFGAELNSEIERQTAAGGAHPPVPGQPLRFTA